MHFLHHKLHEFSYPCHSLVSSFLRPYRLVPAWCVKHKHNISEEWGSGSFKSVRLFVYGRQGNTIDILVRDEWKRGRGLKSRALCTVLKKFKFSKFNLNFFFPSKVKLFLKVYRIESTENQRWKFLNCFTFIIYMISVWSIYLHLALFSNFIRRHDCTTLCPKHHMQDSKNIMKILCQNANTYLLKICSSI